MPEPDKQDEYYAEDHFEGGVKPGGRIYTGPLLLVGASAILGSFLMSSATRKSNNLSFKWLQRRVGAQFGTIAYFVTTNLLLEHNGKRWQRREWGSGEAHRHRRQPHEHQHATS
eukprot:jgi/Chrzof1/10312/Cz04g37030.t1